MLVGHSFGGLIVELLLARGLGRAGVAMSPAPPKGILVLPFSSLKAASPALAHPSKRHGVVTLSPEEFAYGFVNTFSAEDATAAYERYAVPETGRIFYEAGFANFALHPPTDVHFDKDDRAPLLIVGAEQDHTVPASVSRAQHKKYGGSSARTDYLEFEGRPHLFVVGRRLGGGRRRRSTAGSTVSSTRARGRRSDRWISGSTAASPSSPGASKGIGLAVVRALRAEGAIVVAGARSPGALEGLDGVTAVAVDLARPAGRSSSSPRRSRRHDRVDVLVNNVGGVPVRPGGFLSIGDADFEASLQLNFLSALRATRAAVAVMLDAGGGAIVNVASVNAYLPPTRWSSTTAPPRRRCSTPARLWRRSSRPRASASTASLPAPSRPISGSGRTASPRTSARAAGIEPRRGARAGDRGRSPPGASARPRRWRRSSCSWPRRGRPT